MSILKHVNLKSSLHMNIMKLELFIASRFTKKRDGFISLISFLAFIGVFLGVGALIIVMSVMNGFRQELMNQLIGMKGHVVIQNTNEDFTNYKEVIEKLKKNPQVSLTLPTIEQPTILIQNDHYNGVMLYGHDINSLKQHNFLTSKIKEGTLEGLRQSNQIMIGKRLAETYNVGVGDKLTLMNPQGEETLFGLTPKERDFTVAAIFELGMREYDKRFIFASLDTLQDFLNYKNNISHIDIFTIPPENTGNIIYQYLEPDFPNLRILEWKHADSTLFRALNVEKNVMFIILSLMILIAVLNIISSLVMLVKDKTREIAILRTIGMPRSGIIKIFFISGSILGISGTLCGIIFGITFSYYIEPIRLFLERLFQTTLFNPEVYYLSQLPSIVNLKDVILISSISLSCSLLASIYPAIKGSKVEPGVELR